MTTLAYTVSDARTMLRRDLKHQLRYPSVTVMLVAMPVVFLLLFVYVLGGQLGAGLGGDLGPHAGRSAYLNYVVPGVLLATVAAAVQGTSIRVATDMTGGIIDRFRTMAISRVSVLTGHLLGSLVQTVVALAALFGVAFALGFHTSAGPLAWLGVTGVLVLFAFALIWLAVALGLAARSVETASNTPMLLLLLPFLGSGFVRPDTMPVGLRQFCQYQPFSPVVDTVRGLLAGGQVADHAIAAVAWSVGIAAVSIMWATRLYDRRGVATPS